MHLEFLNQYLADIESHLEEYEAISLDEMQRKAGGFIDLLLGENQSDQVSEQAISVDLEAALPFLDPELQAGVDYDDSMAEGVGMWQELLFGMLRVTEARISELDYSSEIIRLTRGLRQVTSRLYRRQYFGTPYESVVETTIFEQILEIVAADAILDFNLELPNMMLRCMATDAVPAGVVFDSEIVDLKRLLLAPAFTEDRFVFGEMSRLQKDGREASSRMQALLSSVTDLNLKFKDEFAGNLESECKALIDIAGDISITSDLGKDWVIENDIQRAYFLLRLQDGDYAGTELEMRMAHFYKLLRVEAMSSLALSLPRDQTTGADMEKMVSRALSKVRRAISRHSNYEDWEWSGVRNEATLDNYYISLLARAFNLEGDWDYFTQLGTLLSKGYLPCGMDVIDGELKYLAFPIVKPKS